MSVDRKHNRQKYIDEKINLMLLQALVSFGSLPNADMFDFRKYVEDLDFVKFEGQRCIVTDKKRAKEYYERERALHELAGD